MVGGTSRTRLSPFLRPVWYYMGDKFGRAGDVRRLVLGRAVGLIVFIYATLAHAAEPLGPDPALPPEEVVRIQLEALQSNDIPTPDAGIRQVWMLAHPNNKRITGPLPRFARMIKGASFRPLIGHAAHDIEPLTTTEAQVAFKVTIETSDGDVLEYLWAVGRVDSGPADGAWLTTSVSPPRQAGRAI